MNTHKAIMEWVVILSIIALVMPRVYTEL